MTNEFDTEAVKAAILSVKKLPTYAFFAPGLPPVQLARAIELYAKEAENEEILALAACENSGKSGFLFTDRALYFRKIMALPHEVVRLPYETITKVEMNNKSLVLITGEKPALVWDLTTTVLWENPRRNIAGTVVKILQAALQNQGDPAAASSTETAAPTVSITPPPPPDDWVKICAFHAPVILIGIPLIFIGLVFMMKWEMLDDETSRIIEHIGAFRTFLFCALWMLPSMYGFGKELDFSFGRYITAMIGLTLLAAYTAAKGAAAGGDAVFIFPIGGGVLALLLAYGLGNAGLSVLRMFRKQPAA